MIKLNYPNISITLSRIDYIFIFLCVIFLGSATVFTQGSLENFGISVDAGNEALIGKSIMFIYSIVILNRHRINILSCLNRNIVFILALWGVLQFLKYEMFSTYPIVRLMNLYFASVLILSYGKKLVYILENVIVLLAKIDLFLWIIMLLIPGIVEYLLNLSPIKGWGLVEGNSWVVFANGFQYEVVKRNIGFAWEPGRFGSILSIAVFFNLIVYKFKIKGNKNFWILSLAVLSTQSTTSYMVYICIMAIYLYNLRSRYLLFATPIVLVFILILMNLDFMSEKMLNLSVFNSNHMIEWQETMDYYATLDKQLVPQRFDALLLEGLNILHDPLIGNATDQYSYLYKLFGVNFSLSNGILRIFANMGIFVGIAYYILCFKASKWMSIEYEYKGIWAFFILFALINISYSWIFEPIFLFFLLYPYIMKVQLSQLKNAN